MRLAATPFTPQIPLIVVGALRSGGSGKTSVTLELAHRLVDLGCRPAILAYRVGATRREKAEDLTEVQPGDDWRRSSEEAVMLRRETGLRVFVTRNRARAWRRLHDADLQSGGGFDTLISDDGFQDPRLDGALRLLLTAPGEQPGLFDLLPAGPWRETWKAGSRADIRLEGPLAGTPGESGPSVTHRLPIPPVHPPMHRFHRRLVLPPGLDRDRPWIVFCGLGDNRPFLADLAREGIRPVAVVEGRDHAAPPLGILRACAARHPHAGMLCTEKDFLKFDPDAGLPLFSVGQGITLDPETLAAVDAYRLLFRNRYLVHYPR